MKKDIIENLKNFTILINKNKRAHFKLCNYDDYKQFNENVMFLKYLLFYLNNGTLPKKVVKCIDLCVNDYLSNIYRENTQKYNSLLKKHPNIIDVISNYRCYKTTPKSFMGYLEHYQNFIKDDNVISKYEVYVSTKNMTPYKDNPQFNIEQTKENVDSNGFVHVKTPPNSKYKGRTLLIPFVERNGVYIAKNQLESGFYDTLKDLQLNQSRTLITRTDREDPDIDWFEDIDLKENNNILPAIRNNMAAHCNIYKYKLINAPSYEGFIILLKQQKLALIAQPVILHNLLHATAQSDEPLLYDYEFIYYPDKTEKPSENNLKNYLESCKIVNVKFSKPEYYSAAYDFAAEITDNYKKLKKEDKENTPIDLFFRKVLITKDCKIKSINLKTYDNIDLIYNFFSKRIKNDPDIKTLTDIGLMFKTFFMFYQINFSSSKNNKDLTLSPKANIVGNTLASLCNNCSFDSKSSQMKKIDTTEKYGCIGQDVFTLSILYIFIYMNLIRNHLTDNIKDDSELQDKDIVKVLQQIEAFDQKHKVFEFSPKGGQMHRPKTSSEYNYIIRHIRNSVAHNNISVKYTNTCNILDSNIYFEDIDQNRQPVKIVANIKKFLEFISIPSLTDYGSPTDVLEANTIAELKEKIKQIAND